MTTVIQNKFDGGLAEDIRTHATDECEFSTGFDILTNPHKLTPYPDAITETHGSSDVANIHTNTVDVALSSTTYYPYAIGNNLAVSTDLTFYKKNTTAITSVWAKIVTDSAGMVMVPGTLISYQGNAYAIGLSGGSYYLRKCDSAGTITAIGNITAVSGASFGALYVHKKDKKLYWCCGNIMAQYDGTTFISKQAGTLSLTLPSDSYCTSLTGTGEYLVIGMSPLSGSGESYMYLWDKSTTLVDVNDSISLGEGTLQVLENLNNTIIAVMQAPINFATPSVLKMQVKSWSGGQVDVLKNLIIGNYPTISRLLVAKAKSNNKLYFALNNTDAVYLVAKNNGGQYIVTKDRYLKNGTTTGNNNTGDFVGISVVGDSFWTAFTVGSTNYFYRSMSVEDTPTYTATAKYRTTINPSMPLKDRTDQKQLEAVQIAFTGSTSGTVVLKYSIDGGSWTTIISESISSAVASAIEATNESSTGTVFGSGNEIQFEIQTTGGVAPIELKYRYSVLNATI